MDAKPIRRYHPRAPRRSRRTAHMAYGDALTYLKQNYSLLAAWIEKTVGPPLGCKDIINVNKDLKDGTNRDRPLLVQGALLTWIATGRPKGKDGWGTEVQTKQ